MSTAQGLVAIEISRREGENTVTTVNARLLTGELMSLIERQNVHCADVNCMKWPVVGLGRWATFKCILMKSDLKALIPSADEYTADGYTVHFIVGDKAYSKTTVFPRMHLAHIQPLMVSESGPVKNPDDSVNQDGEAIYLCTFHDDRWAARAYRVHGEADRRYWSPGWDPSLEQKMASAYTPKDLSSDLITGLAFNDEDWWRFFRIDVDEYEDLVNVGNALWEGGDGVRGAGPPWRMPSLKWLDHMAVKCGVHYVYVPHEDPAGQPPNLSGKYRVTVSDISIGISRMRTWLNTYRDDIIAGSVVDAASGTTSLTGFLRAASIPNVVAQSIRPKTVVMNYRKELPGNGAPPDVFGQVLNQSTAFGVGKFRTSSLPDPFDGSPRQGFYYPPSLPKLGEADLAFINADIWKPDATFSNADTYVEETTTTESNVPARYMEKFAAGVCDIWLRGWVMPKHDEAWAGGSWVELRLQTDGKGFGFPTTRIHGSLEDPLLGPLEDDCGTEIEATGMAQAWRGEDGRTRVHVPMPFAIPCLISIYDHDQIATNVYRYYARPAHRKGADTASVGVGQDYYGGVTRLSTVNEIIAYNTVELNNTSTAAGPGYKLPLEEPGFDVLPIGMDRDGAKREVVVMAFLAMANQGGESRVVAYFTLHNPIDGECTV